MTKIVDLFHTKLDSINIQTEFIGHIKAEPVDEHNPNEVTPLISELSSDKNVASTSNGIKEKWIYYLKCVFEKHRINVLNIIFFLIHWKKNGSQKNEKDYVASKNCN